MHNFTLKIYYSKLERGYFCNDKHEMGGIDIRQRMAWKHLFGGVLFLYESDIVYDMANMHNWKVEITEVE